jgi:four helix bundle protein
MGTVYTYRDLEVWHRADELGKEVYKLTRLLPPEENENLADQMRRAALSIPANIAEGQGRNTTKELIYFLGVARASDYEVQSHISFCVTVGYFTEDQAMNAYMLSRRVEQMLNKFISRLKDKLIMEESQGIKH